MKKISRETAVQLGLKRTHTGKAAGLSQARERWRVYDVAREVQAAC
jgi:hypothetical protein